MSYILLVTDNDLPVVASRDLPVVPYLCGLHIVRHILYVPICPTVVVCYTLYVTCCMYINICCILCATRSLLNVTWIAYLDLWPSCNRKHTLVQHGIHYRTATRTRACTHTNTHTRTNGVGGDLSIIKSSVITPGCQVNNSGSG